MKVVIIKFGALGDIIISTPVIKKLIKEHANDDLYLLTSQPFAKLFEEWQDLNVKYFPRKGFCTSVQSLCWLRKQNFDRVYDLQSNDRSRVLCSLSGIKEKVGNHNRFPYTHHPGDCYTGQNHIFDRHNQVLNSVGIEAAEARPWLPVPETAHQNVNRWMDKHNLNKRKLVLMHAGASHLHPEKRWPHFLELAKKLSAIDCEIVWLGADDDTDLNMKLARETGIDASNSFSIIELIALGQRAMFAVTNDSGPMHVLSCTGIPVYALFGPTNWRRNHAIGQQEHVISLDKSNSSWNVSDLKETDTGNLDLISVEMVYSLLLKEMRISL
jgi:ADP-heptose:LPS heptosyltransferase